MISIQGKGVSSGVGVGPLYFYHRTKTEIPPLYRDRSRCRVAPFQGRADRRH